MKRREFPGKKLINYFSNNKISDSSKLIEFAEKKFKFDENGRKFSEWLENTVVKGEMALFPTVFSKDLYCRQEKTRACFGKGLLKNCHGKRYKA